MVAAAAATGILSLYNPAALADSNAEGVAKDSPGALSGNTVQVPVHVPINLCGNTVEIVGVANSALRNSCANESGSDKSHEVSRRGSSGHDDGKGTGGSEESGSSNGPSGTGGSSDERGSSSERGSSDEHGSPGASAHAVAKGSPGVGSGNVVQVPVDIPVNACGNTLAVVGVFDDVFGNKCVNDESSKGRDDAPEDHEDTPWTPDTPESPDTPNTPDTPRHQPPKSPRATPPAKPSTSAPGKHTATSSTMAQTGAEGVLGASAAGAALIAGGAVLYRRSRAASRR